MLSRYTTHTKISIKNRNFKIDEFGTIYTVSKTVLKKSKKLH